IGVQGTRTPGAGRASLGLVTHYGSSLLKAESAGEDEAQLVEHRMAGALLAELGVGPRTAIGFAAPFVVYQDAEGLAGLSPPAHPTALGDARVSARYRFIGDVPKDALSNDDGPGLALMVTGIVPGGDDEAFVGEGPFRLDAQLLADVHLLGSGVGASVGIRHRFERRELFNESIRDEFTFGAAIRLPIPPLHPLQAMVEVRGATDFQGAATTAVEGQLGLWLPLGELALVLAGGPGFTGGIGVPGVRVVAGLWYAPTEDDADHDGVADAKDQCPPLPEDLDQFQDHDGCPDPDNDNDLVPDADDLCPNIEALEDQDDDEDGCTDK
ncbi:MAG TPA: hypothetical protein VK509_12295, partial [Polyangiales bacterium]|nr:hypothetical protein [Polyangiales bacterium]